VPFEVSGKSFYLRKRYSKSGVTNKIGSKKTISPLPEKFTMTVGRYLEFYTVPQKTCYNLDIHDPIVLIFGRSVTEKVRNQTMLCFPTTLIWCFNITFQKKKPRRQRTGVLCVQHSPTAAVLSTSFLLNHVPNSPQLNALITRFRESYSRVNMSCESKRLKKSSSDWLNSRNALIQRVKKCNFLVSRFAR